MSNWIIYSIGFLSQILFSSRLLVQWLQSEKGGPGPPFGGDYSAFIVPFGRTRPMDGFCTMTSVPAAISTVT